MKPETQELPIIDWELCLKLANHKEEVAQELLSLVIEQLPQDLQTIQQKYQEKNHSELLRYVHKLHGALCYSGLPRLKHVVSTLEGQLKQKNLDDAQAQALMQELEKEAQNVLAKALAL